MSRGPLNSSIVGRRMRSRRETLGWSQERVGVAVGIEESSSRTRISRYESGVHEPPTQTARLIAKALKVPLAYLYCEDDAVAALLVSLYQLSAGEREVRVGQFSVMLAEGGS